MQILMLSILFIASSCNSSTSSPDFLSNLLIDRNVSDVKDDYKDLFKDVPCSPSAENLCNQVSMKCKCHQVTISQTRELNRSIFLVSNDNKIVLAQDGSNTQPYLFEKHLETAKSVFGTTLPTKIYEMPSAVQGFKSIFALWELEKGYAAGGLACPLEKVGGSPKLDAPLRKCFVFSSRASRIQKFEPSPDMTLTQLEY